jgi:Fe2+ or Zn2+ uptake regulation protein
MDCLKSKKVTLSRPRRMILRALAAHEEPVSLDVLAGELKGACDLATIYRTMHAFQEAGIVREVKLMHHRASFVLVTHGEHCDYLVCDGCGSVSDLPTECPIVELEEQLAARSGFHQLWHEVVFHGICQQCRKGNQKLQ